MIFITEVKQPYAIKCIQTLNAYNFKNNYLLSNNKPTEANLKKLRYEKILTEESKASWLEENKDELEFIIDLSEDDDLSKFLWDYGVQNQVPILILNPSGDLRKWIPNQVNSPFFWAAYNQDALSLNGMIDLIQERDKKGFL